MIENMTMNKINKTHLLFYHKSSGRLRGKNAQDLFQKMHMATWRWIIRLCNKDIPSPEERFEAKGYKNKIDRKKLLKCRVPTLSLGRPQIQQ